MTIPLGYWYQCPNCQTVLVAEGPSRPGPAYRCNLCRSWMRFLHTRELPPEYVGEGLIWNPGHEDVRAQTTPEERLAFMRSLKERGGHS